MKELNIIEKYYEVIGRTIELLQTIEEGILHIQSKISELRYEESLMLLQDIVAGIESIENAIKPMMPELQENNIENLTASLKANINKALTDYEHEKGMKQLDEGIVQDFNNWKQEIERVLKPYIAS